MHFLTRNKSIDNTHGPVKRVPGMFFVGFIAWRFSEAQRDRLRVVFAVARRRAKWSAVALGFALRLVVQICRDGDIVLPRKSGLLNTASPFSFPERWRAFAFAIRSCSLCAAAMFGAPRSLRRRAL